MVMINRSTQKAAIKPKTAQFFALFESLNALRSVATVGLVVFINKILLLIQVGTGDQGTCQLIKLKRGRIDTI
jgi:hypothetical protein